MHLARVIEAIPFFPIADIPFTKPKSRIECNWKGSAHLYSDTVPLSDVPQLEQTEHLQTTAESQSPEELLPSEESLLSLDTFH